MSNTCFTTYLFKGEREELEKIVKYIETVREETPQYKTTWMGMFFEHEEIDPMKKIRAPAGRYPATKYKYECASSLDSYWMTGPDEQPCLFLYTQDAWSIHTDPIDMILIASGSRGIDVWYMAEEEATDYYVTNDVEYEHFIWNDNLKSQYMVGPDVFPLREKEIREDLERIAKEKEPKPQALVKEERLPDSLDIALWLSEHAQAYADCAVYFGKQNLPIAEVPSEVLASWISEHDTLYLDFIKHFDLSDRENEDLTEKDHTEPEPPGLKEPKWVNANDPEVRKEIYWEVELEHRIRDAMRHTVEYIETIQKLKGDFEPLSEDVVFDFEYIAQQFIDNHDCNVPENEQWDNLISEYIKENEIIELMDLSEFESGSRIKTEKGELPCGKRKPKLKVAEPKA